MTEKYPHRVESIYHELNSGKKLGEVIRENHDFVDHYGVIRLMQELADKGRENSERRV